MLVRIAGIEYARMEALTLLNRFGVESREHLRIEAFAKRLGVELVETEMKGARGQVIAGPDGAHIVLPHDLRDPVERRWLIAHELGHFVLGHPALPAGELCRPRKRRRRRDRRHEEDEANGFASVLLIPDKDLAAHCDARPMTLDVPLELATLCRVPFPAAAQRLIEVSWRVCAVIVSQHGMMRSVWPSLPFLMLCAGRIWSEDPLLPGSLAGRFFDTGEPCGPPALVPASAWLAGVGPELQIQEHSVAFPSVDIVLTMLWDAAESDAPRPAEATTRAVAVYRDYLLGELEADPSIARVRV
jgi:Zn-dependent peptidase ImmA (M78 family)